MKNKNTFPVVIDEKKFPHYTSLMDLNLNHQQSGFGNIVTLHLNIVFILLKCLKFLSSGNSKN